MLTTSSIRYLPHSRTAELPVWRIPENWIILALLLFFAMKGALPHITNAAQQGAHIEDRTGNRIEILLMWTCGCLLMARRMDRILSYAMKYWIWMALPLWALLSVLWSQDPKTSFIEAVMLVLDTLFAFYLVDKFEPQRLLRLLQFTCLSSLILSGLFIVVLPRYSFGYEHEWRGIFAHKNDLGVFTILLMSASFFVPKQSRVQALLGNFTVGLGLIFIFLSQSRTAWLVCVSYFAYLIIARASLKVRKLDFAILLMITATASLAVLLGIVSDLPWLMKILNKDMTFNGRTQIWNAVVEAIMKHPWTGYGYNAFWSSLQLESRVVFAKIGFSVAHAHNGYLETMLEVGVVGLGLFLVSLIIAFKSAPRALRSDRRFYVQWCIGIVVAVLISNLDESYIAAVNQLPTILYVVACVGIVRESATSRYVTPVPVNASLYNRPVDTVGRNILTPKGS